MRDGGDNANRRRANRTRLNLRGRYLLTDGGEHPCEAIDASVTGLALKAYVIPLPGERVVAYIDSLGRLEGVVVAQRPGGFAMQLQTPSSRLEKLALKLAQFGGESHAPTPPAPADIRPRRAILHNALGQRFEVEVSEETDRSARVHARFLLLPGAQVTLDERPGAVSHQTTGGFFVAFDSLRRRPG